MKIFKLRAVAEDVNDPLLDCYDPTALAELSAARPSPTRKEPFTMSNLDPVHVTAEPRRKVAMPGIGHGSPARLLDTLVRLGLCSSELATPLKSIAAAGAPIKELFQVNVWELDRALAGVECSIENRINFKSALDQLNILNVPK
jgi:hypothetical protein